MASETRQGGGGERAIRGHCLSTGAAQEEGAEGGAAGGVVDLWQITACMQRSFPVMLRGITGMGMRSPQMWRPPEQPKHQTWTKGTAPGLSLCCSKQAYIPRQAGENPRRHRAQRPPNGRAQPQPTRPEWVSHGWSPSEAVEGFREEVRLSLDKEDKRSCIVQSLTSTHATGLPSMASSTQLHALSGPNMHFPECAGKMCHQLQDTLVHTLSSM
eukprot:1156899-Pelagomonas_calceolata.AAC.2